MLVRLFAASLLVLGCAAVSDPPAPVHGSGAGPVSSANAGGSGGSVTPHGGAGGDLDLQGGQDSGGAPSCSDTLAATVRDFSIQHPDFQDFVGWGIYPGLVEPMLGGDQKPVYAHSGSTAQTTGPSQFVEWYNDVSGINFSFPVSIALTELSPGELTYDNATFFPIDGMGWGDEGGFGHNFWFTTEIHVTFPYEGGEVFTFTGDDDLWLFINGRLAIDLGGTHIPESGTVDLDVAAATLGIVVGNSYPLDVFHAERRTGGSNFHIETTIDCFVPPPPPR